jgi:serine/threonine protein kinase/WD40 repeat protein
MSTALELVEQIRRYELVEASASINTDPIQTAREAGSRLVAAGVLTPFQLEALLRGKGDRLRVGPYLLLDRIGAGGMGEVFRARHTRLGREVALKLIRQDKLESPTVEARFLRELRGTARVEHPNVVRVFNAGRDERHLYFSMQYVRGDSLAKIVQENGPLPISEACRAIADAALGLEAVHTAGLVHRDIKPANLVRETATGRTKVLDLGLAGLTIRSFDDTAGGTLTETGTLLGTHDYMAPEQARNPHNADSRSDLYSLGCTLFCLLTGRPPFASGSPVEKLMKHVYTSPPDIRDTRSDVPPELAAVVAKLLAKEPAERFQSGSALADALRSFGTFTPNPIASAPLGEEFESLGEQFSFNLEMDELPPTVAILPKQKARRLPIILLGLLFSVLAIIVVFFSWLTFSSDSKTVPSAIAGTLPTDKLSLVRAALGKPGADVPKLRAELYSMHGENRGGPLGTSVAQALRSVSSPLDELKLLDPGRGKPPLVALRSAPGPRHWGPAHAIAVSPSGETVATVGADRLVRLWSAQNGKPLRVLGGFGDPIYDVTFSPDSKRVAATSRLANANDTEGFERKARIWDVATGELLVTAGKNQDWVVSWRFAPNGETALAGTYDRLHLRSTKDGEALKTFTAKNASTNWVMKAGFSRNGEYAIAACNNFHLHVWNVSTGEEVRAWKASDWFMDDFDLSQTRDEVLTVADGRIRIWDWTTGKKRAEYQFQSSPIRASFSPNGKQILVGSADGRFRLIDSATEKLSEPINGHDGPVHGICWDKINQRAFSVGHDGILRRWSNSGQQLVEIDPPPPIRQATALAFTDEDRTLIIARPGQPPETWDISSSQTAMTSNLPIVEPGSVAISPDGRRVLLAAGPAMVRVVTVPSGESKEIDLGTAGRILGLAWLPDAKRFLIATSEPRAELSIIDATTGRNFSRLPLASEQVEGLPTLSGDGKWAAAALRTGGIGWWDLSANKFLVESPRPNPGSAVSGLLFSPTHEQLRIFGTGWQVTELPIAGTRPGRQIWDADLRIPLGGTISADAKMTAMCTKAAQVILLSESSKVLREWSLPGRVTALGFSINGRYLALAHSDGGIGVYRVQ